MVTVPVLLTHSWPLVFAAAALLGATFGLGFGGSLRHLSNVVPADQARRDDVGVLSCSPTPRWPSRRSSRAGRPPGGHLDAVFPWFAGVVALACLAAAVVGVFNSRAAARTTDTAVAVTA